MKVGLLSDTHGNAARTRQALAVFRAERVEAILHAGDVGTEDIFNDLLELDVPVHAVSGNCDYDLDYPAFGELELGGRRFALIHGHDEIRFRNAMRGGAYDYIITGHTHVRRDERIGPTRVINPGAVHRSSPPSCAVLDTETGTLTFHDLKN